MARRHTTPVDTHDLMNRTAAECAEKLGVPPAEVRHATLWRFEPRLEKWCLVSRWEVKRGAEWIDSGFTCDNHASAGATPS